MTRKFSKFRKSQNGATAIEFALLALPFSALLFAIVETAIVFFINSTMNHAVNEAARQIRTGIFQTDVGCAEDPAAFKTAVCDLMAGLGDCEGDMRIDVVSPNGDRFDPTALAPPPDPGDSDDPEDVPASIYEDTGAGQVVIVRAQYYYPLALPGELTFLSNRPGNVRLIQTTTAFRNEPFPGTC